MKTHRFAAALMLLAALAGTAFAQAYPSRPVHLVVPAAAGGTIDILARALSVKLGEGLGEAVVVENRPGAGTNIGMEAVASTEGRAPAARTAAFLSSWGCARRNSPPELRATRSSRAAPAGSAQCGS